MTMETLNVNLATTPFVQLSGEDGNAFFIIGRCRSAMRRAYHENDLDDQFTDDFQRFCDVATNGNYDHLLQTVMANFETS